MGILDNDQVELGDEGDVIHEGILDNDQVVLDDEGDVIHYPWVS